MRDGGDIAGGGLGEGGFGGSGDTGATGYGYDSYGSPIGTNLGLTPQQQVAYDIIQAIYATQGNRFGESGRLDQYGNPAGIHGQTGTNMGYNLIDADFTPATALATVDVRDMANVMEQLGGGMPGSGAMSGSFANSDGGLMSEGGGEYYIRKPHRLAYENAFNQWESDL